MIIYITCYSILYIYIYILMYIAVMQGHKNASFNQRIFPFFVLENQPLQLYLISSVFLFYLNVQTLSNLGNFAQIQILCVIYICFTGVGLPSANNSLWLMLTETCVRSYSCQAVS